MTLIGFADTHNHQFAYLGFGGKAFWGAAYGDLEHALSPCTAAHGPGGVRDVMGNVMRTMSLGLPATAALGHATGGAPDFHGWPRWDSVSHQAVHEDWLFRAVEGGLRLMVMLAVNNEFFCSRANRAPGRTCRDMEAVDLQLQAAKDMEAHIDHKAGGPGLGWYRIVSSPAEARRVIGAGKLAVVLGIEVDYLFDCRSESDLTADELRERLDTYHGLGVRHILPVHFGDNGFGATAFQNAMITDAGAPPLSPRNPLGTLDAYRIRTEDARWAGYEYRSGRRNVAGLTDLGRTLITEMIARKMLIDIDHMSARTKADVLEICEAARYPVLSSHSAFLDISVGDKRHEGQLRAEEVERIRGVGGMLAPIVRPGTLTDVTTYGQVEHCCGGTSNTLAQSYLYAVSAMPGRPVALGTDINGFAGLPGPRFGPEACPGGASSDAQPGGVEYPFTAAATGAPMHQSVVGNRTFDFNLDGLAHIGLLPDLIADLESQGVTQAQLQPLLRSAEGYIRSWERASRPAGGAITAVTGLLV